MTQTDEAAGEKLARQFMENMPPHVIAAAKALCWAERIPWDQVGPQQQYTFCADASAALTAGLESLTSPEQLARIVSVTGLSLQTVTEVAKELRRG
jgi:hypothetical protein